MIELDKKYVTSCFAWTTFDPEKRAERFIANYKYTLKAIQKAVISENEDEVQNLDIIEKLSIRYKKLIDAYLVSVNRCASSVIAGGSGYNVVRQEKRNSIAHNREGKLYYFQDNMERYIRKEIRKRTSNHDLMLEDLKNCKEELERRELEHPRLIEANKLLKSPNLSRESLTEILPNLNESDINLQLKHKYGFNLSSNRKRIKDLKNRIEILEYKKDAKNVEKDYLDGFFKAVYNYEEDRVQLIFKEKPSPVVITFLKKRLALRWSPSNNAWQRKLTPNAKYCIRHNFQDLLEVISN